MPTRWPVLTRRADRTDTKTPNMPSKHFVHLRAHTEFSVVDGTLRIDDLAKAARDDGQGAVAMTDFNNIFGAVKFYGACRKAGVKPVLGCDIRMKPRGTRTAPSRLLVLVQNSRGYNNLCELISRGWLEGTESTRDNQPVHDWAWLKDFSEGLIILSGASDGIVGQFLLAGDLAGAKVATQELADLAPGRFYLEVQRAGRPQDEAHLRLAVTLAADMGLPVVATHPMQFLDQQDHSMHEARICIAEGHTLVDPNRPRLFTKDQHFKTIEEMGELFADLPIALENAGLIAERCSLTLNLGTPQLPNFPTPLLTDGPDAGKPMPIERYFRELSQEGLEDRLRLLYPKDTERDAQRPRYQERLEFEIATILKMGFPGYFLIVADFIVWAKANGCPVGPGRGSGAGSLVAYALKITDLDPLAYNLLFERFLNPDRVSMPDFDVDFCQTNRDRVIDYVKSKYGRDAVSQIATFGTMAAKAALRDVGRVMGMGYGQVDSISKLIPSPPGKVVTLAQVPPKPSDKVIYARLESPELVAREKADDEIASLLSLAAKMEGTVRNIGMHAGGVLIAPGKITDFCPLYQQPGSTSAVSQFDKDDVEAAGLVKFDFLGLATLTILEVAKEYIIRRHPQQKDFNYETIDLADPAVYKLFCDGDTEAVFQFESRGMQSLLRDAKPNRLEDLIALNALYRPGPMDLIPTFVARKHGREEVEYPHPLVEKVLAETYGIMVYQEQVMQTAQMLGGYTLGGADLLRRAMGKKKAEEMAKHRAIFREGAAKNEISARDADEIFNLMEKFAGYGFNKSHAAAYSLLAYQTGYIKVHFTSEFYAANLTIEQGDTEKLQILIEDAKRFDVQIEPPHINVSTHRFEPVGQRHIRYSLAAIKGTGSQAIEAIMQARQTGGEFKSFFDFCARVDRRRVNKRVVEAMIKAGAFDALMPAGVHRAQLIAAIGMAYEWAEAQQVSADAGQGGLFDLDGGHGSLHTEPALPEVTPWSGAKQLEAERTAIGFCLSGHMFDQYEQEVRRFANRRIVALSSKDAEQGMVTVAGIICSVKVFSGGSGSRAAVVTIDDRSGRLDISISSEMLHGAKDAFKVDSLLIARGRLSTDRFSGGWRMQAREILPLPQARALFARHVLVRMKQHSPQLAAALKQSAANGRNRDAGKLPLRLALGTGDACAEVDLGNRIGFDPHDHVLNQWRQFADAVELVY